VAEAAVTPHLRAEGLHLRYPRSPHDAVRDVHLSVAKGELVCLVGPNGSGKSTTMAGLARELRPRSGSILLDGCDAWGMARREFARRVARLPQEPRCPEGLTVEELVSSGRNPHVPLLGGWHEADRCALHEALRAMDLLDLRRAPVETLSGGVRRRAWLAMVLCQQAELLLLDEPTTGLDMRHQWEVLELLRRVNRERGTTMIVVLHDLEQAAHLADRLAVFYRGRLYEDASPREVLNPEMLLDVFHVATEVVHPELGPPTIIVRHPADPLRNL
jgi:iron complex transport system ATP-binding protein